MSGPASSLEHDPSATLRKPPREQSRWLMALAGAARLPLILAGAAPLVSGALLVVQAWLLASALDAAIVRQAPRLELLGQILAIAALMLARACICLLYTSCRREGCATNDSSGHYRVM